MMSRSRRVSLVSAYDTMEGMAAHVGRYQRMQQCRGTTAGVLCGVARVAVNERRTVGRAAGDGSGHVDRVQ